MVKIIKAATFGGAEVLTLSEAKPAPLGPTEVRVDVEASGVGFVDVLQRAGAYPGLEPGFVPGLEVAGRVSETGADVAADMLGKRVFAMMGGGGYSQQVTAPVAMVVPLPDSVGAAEAVALGINAAVAYRCVEVARVKHGQRVLVRGAGGGIGVLAVQAAKAIGAEVTAVTSSSERGARLLELGASHISDRTAEGLPLDATFDAIIDPVGGTEIGALLNALAPNGHYALCGVVGGMPAPDFALGLVANFQNSPTLSAVSLSSLSPQELAAAYTAAFDAFVQGRIAPVIADILPLEQAVEAHKRIEAGQVFGKLVLKP